MTENAEERPEVQDEEQDEVQAKRDRIAELRAEIAQAEAEKAAEVQRESAAVELKMLGEEEARLERELALIKGTPPPVQPPDLDNSAGTDTLVSPRPAQSGEGDYTPELGQLAGDESDDDESSTTDKE